MAACVLCAVVLGSTMFARGGASANGVAPALTHGRVAAPDAAPAPAPAAAPAADRKGGLAEKVLASLVDHDYSAARGEGREKRVAFVYWPDGHRGASTVQVMCLRNLMVRNRAWHVEVVDRHTIRRFLPPVPEVSHLLALLHDAFDADGEALQFSAGVLLGLMVLHAHGGVWVNPSLWMTQPLFSTSAVASVGFPGGGRSRPKPSAAHAQQLGILTTGARSAADAGGATAADDGVTLIAAHARSPAVRAWLAHSLATRLGLLHAKEHSPLSDLLALAAHGGGDGSNATGGADLAFVRGSGSLHDGGTEY